MFSETLNTDVGEVSVTDDISVTECVNASVNTDAKIVKITDVHWNIGVSGHWSTDQHWQWSHGAQWGVSVGDVGGQ